MQNGCYDVGALYREIKASWLTLFRTISVASLVTIVAFSSADAQDAGFKTISQNSSSELQNDLSIIDGYYSSIKEKVGAKALKSDANLAKGKDSVDEGGKIEKLSLPVPSSHTQEIRDPFALTNQIHASGYRKKGGYGFVPNENASGLPEMRMKGIIKKGKEDIAALLEIEGDGTYVVRPNDTVGLRGAGTGSVIKVKSIDALSVVVELGSMGQVVVVR